MAQPSPAQMALIRRGFRHFNRFMLLMWRVDLARWLNFEPHTLGQFMVLVHTGRKSGLRRYTPVNYARLGDHIYCVAGFGQVADWYRNLLATPQMEVWLQDGWWGAMAEEISDQPDTLPILREVLINSGFAAVAAGVNPHTLNDEALREKTTDYRLMRITLTAPRTGTGGPGEYGWVWQISTLLLIGMLLNQRRARR